MTCEAIYKYKCVRLALVTLKIQLQNKYLVEGEKELKQGQPKIQKLRAENFGFSYI
jgi:hypothetical protein